MLIHIAFDVAVLVTTFTYNNNVLRETREFYQQDMRVGYSVILGIVLLFNLLTVLFLGHLISFHLVLQGKGMTTFEYIMDKANRKNQKSKIYREVNQEKAKEEEPPAQQQVLETLEREGTNRVQAPKTEDKKNDDLNVNFKAEELPVDIENKESIDLIEDGKILRGNTTEDVTLPPPLTGERKT